jgi:hypothetical protein
MGLGEYTAVLWNHGIMETGMSLFFGYGLAFGYEL